MGVPKKHHYTPNFILNRFATAERRLWVLDKATGGCWAKDGGKDERYDAFAENHYNTITDSDGNSDLGVEHHLAKIEREAASIVDDLVRYAEAGLYPELSGKRRAQLSRFLWAQHLRAPWLRHHMMASEYSRRLFREAVEKANRLFELEADRIDSLMGREDDFLTEAAKKVVTTTDTVRRAANFMTTMSVDLARAPSGAGTSFITSDRPCLISPVARPVGKVVMALAKTVMLQLSRLEESQGDVLTLGADTIDMMNRQTLETAARFVAGPSREYLKGLWEEDDTEDRSSKRR